MEALFIGYAMVLLLVTVVLVSLSAYAWNRGDYAGGRALSVLLGGVSVWCLCAAAGVLTRGTGLALLWARGVFVGAVPAIAALFVFALAYAGHDRYLDRRLYALLSIEPLAFFAIMVADPDGLVYQIGGQSASAMYGWEIGYGSVYLAHLMYSYLLVTAASAVIVHFALVGGDLYRRQLYAILLAIALPWFGSVVDTLGDLPLTPTPILFGASCIALTWAVFKARLLDISPVAYREIVDSINSAVVIVDTAGVVLEVNDAGQTLFGDADLAGRPVADALGDWPGLIESYRERADSGANRGTVVEHGDRYFDAHISPLRDSRDALVGHVLLVHEITERKRRERELEHRNRQLDQFAAVVSHDLRNPLNVASGRLALARERNDPTEFDRVEAAHERMSRIIDDVLAFARDEQTTNAEPLDLSAVAEAAWAHVDTADATLEVDEDRVLVGDRDQLLQLFENVYRNSVEHGGDGVAIRVTGTADGFEIADDGPGIPEADREAVFEHGVSRSDTGTGLGLAIVEHVADSHGWTVEMTESDRGGARLVVGGHTAPDPAVDGSAV
ncbi:histidine kinase N-terminal 7TM domain-containing protein [Haloarcula salina]|uniref:histidine kinase N-terminal 7TM domain-containing protein n=1 Tax=Haloarcula salina TaxID=1429914 RepID=UPI003C702A41